MKQGRALIDLNKLASVNVYTDGIEGELTFLPDITVREMVKSILNQVKDKKDSKLTMSKIVLYPCFDVYCVK